MYIPEFWCGVIATVLAEVAAAILGTVIIAKNGRNEGDRDKTEETDS